MAKACASNQQKINGEYKTAQAIQHGTSHDFQFQTMCLPCGSQQSEKSELISCPKKNANGAWLSASGLRHAADSIAQWRSELLQRGDGAQAMNTR